MQTTTYYTSRNTFSSTNSAQSFIRLFVWLVCFVILGALALMLKTAFIEFEEALFVFLFIDAILSSIISRMFYVLPEWKNMVLLRLGRFEAIKAYETRTSINFRSERMG